MTSLRYDDRLLREVGLLFGLRVDQALQVPAPGSPNRSVYRAVVRCAGERYILEQVAPEQAAQRRRVAHDLAALHDRGLKQVILYEQASGGGYLAAVNGTSWMASRYVASDPLPRPGWVDDSLRGEALGGFMLQLRAASERASLTPAEPWRLELWLPELVRQLRRHNPEVLRRVREPLRLAQQALLGESRLPLAWAYGDLHPLNVLWRGSKALAVIDWEFCGPKAELYDLANLIGCVGIESPAALTGPFVQGLTRRLGQTNTLSPASWAALPGYVLALRFAWLSEWLRSRDREMVALECDYLDVLLQGQEVLSVSWAG